jgi:acetyl esterase/lipase
MEIHSGGIEPTDFHPELRRVAQLLPRFSFSPTLVKAARLLMRLHSKRPPVLDDVSITDMQIPVADTSIRVRIYDPRKRVPAQRKAIPALLWIHGGGFLIGIPEQDQDANIALCRELGIVIVAVSYRLAPEHPFPIPLEDCYAALAWMHAQADSLCILPDRIAIAGASAGGGLAAGLAQLAHDRKQIRPVFQLLIYPMLDDRTTLRTVTDSKLRMWTAKSNVLGWTSYLNTSPGGPDVSPYAAPARRSNLRGLAPAWIGVGSFDLFYDEDIAYAKRLVDAQVLCELIMIEGAYHAFDSLNRNADVVRTFRASYVEALRRALL